MIKTIIKTIAELSLSLPVAIIIGGGTDPGKCGVPCRTKKDGYPVFDNRNGKRRQAALGGAGGE